MNIDIREIGRNDKTQELEFNIVNVDNNETVGYLFTAGVDAKTHMETHVAYEVWPKFRGNNVATDALKMITSRISHPVLEITHDNVASKRVAIKAGYTLVRSGKYFEMYELKNDSSKKK